MHLSVLYQLWLNIVWFTVWKFCVLATIVWTVVIPYHQITKAYVTSRLESVETVLRENTENPLDDKTMVTQQLEQMATIGRSVCVWEGGGVDVL